MTDVPKSTPSGRLPSPPDLAVAELPVAGRRRSATVGRIPPWIVLRWCDVLGIFGILLACTAIRWGMLPIETFASARLWSATAVIMTALYLVNAYRIDPDEPAWQTAGRAIFGTLAGGAVIAAVLFVVGPELGTLGELGRSIVIVAVALIAVWTALVRLWLRQRSGRLRGRSAILVVGGAGTAALDDFLPRLAADGGRVVAVLEYAMTLPPGVEGRTFERLDDALQEPWDQIVLAVPAGLPSDVESALLRARLEGAEILDLAGFYAERWRRVPVHWIRADWFVNGDGFGLMRGGANENLKRALDIVLALAFFVPAMPLLIVLGLLVKLDSAGPALFSQPRVGRRGAVFTCWKVRTMTVGSEAGPKYTGHGDRRITRLGAFLRKSRLDELPQLWNVLIGEMSFIGPRAEWVKCVDDYAGVIPWYHLRHIVRPGLTGWAQVNYPYGAGVEDARMKLEYDLYYLRNHSLALDLVILLRTVRVVLWGQGAR